MNDSLSCDDKPSPDKSRTLSVVPTSCVLSYTVIYIYTERLLHDTFGNGGLTPGIAVNCQ